MPGMPLLGPSSSSGSLSPGPCPAAPPRAPWGHRETPQEPPSVRAPRCHFPAVDAILGALPAPPWESRLKSNPSVYIHTPTSAPARPLGNPLTSVGGLSNGRLLAPQEQCFSDAFRPANGPQHAPWKTCGKLGMNDVLSTALKSLGSARRRACGKPLIDPTFSAVLPQLQALHPQPHEGTQTLGRTGLSFANSGVLPNFQGPSLRL